MSATRNVDNSNRVDRTKISYPCPKLTRPRGFLTRFHVPDPQFKHTNLSKHKINLLPSSLSIYRDTLPSVYIYHLDNIKNQLDRKNGGSVGQSEELCVGEASGDEEAGGGGARR